MSHWCEEVIGKSIKNSCVTELRYMKFVERALVLCSLKLSHTTQRKYISAFGDTKEYFEAFYGHCPGVYLGAKRLTNGNLLHVWSGKLYFELADRKYVKNATEAACHVEYLINKYNIIGPETGTIMKENIPDGSITYEEVINK